MDGLEVLEQLQRLDVRQVASDSLVAVEDVMADLNASQLAQSTRSDGSETLPTYRDITIEKKKKKSGLSGVSDRVTLYDTGAFYRALYAKVQGEDIEFGSADWKADKLDEKYSTQRGSIFGLTEDSRDDLVESHLRDEWERRVEDVTGLEFE